MVEDVGDNTGLGDDSDDAQCLIAHRTAADIDSEHASQPSHLALRRPGRWVMLARGRERLDLTMRRRLGASGEAEGWHGSKN